jgi:hypothetical protein
MIHRKLSKEKLREVKVLAAAILRLLEWQSNMMQLKQEARIRRMIKRQLLLRKNVEFSLTD